LTLSELPLDDSKRFATYAASRPGRTRDAHGQIYRMNIKHDPCHKLSSVFMLWSSAPPAEIGCLAAPLLINPYLSLTYDPYTE